MTDSLERLLREAKQHAWKETHKDPRVKLVRERQSEQTMRWQPGSLVGVVHTNGENLGVFREQLFNTGGRRLVPEQGIPDRIELVSGQHWLEARTNGEHTHQDSEFEIAQIEQRFYELLAEWPEVEADGEIESRRFGDDD